MKISEGDKTVASYDYTIEGQVASSTEYTGEAGKNAVRHTDFLWDDLALIQRNGTELTNEPYMTGGNPILADNKVLFNDMLGSTLGVAADGSYTAMNRTSFGELDNESNSDFNC